MQIKLSKNEEWQLEWQMRDRVNSKISLHVTKSGPDPLRSQPKKARLVEYLKYTSNLGYC